MRGKLLKAINFLDFTELKQLDILVFVKRNNRKSPNSKDLEFEVWDRSVKTQ